MKKILILALSICNFLGQAQTAPSDAMFMSLNKNDIKKDANVDFIDQSKIIDLPTDGLFLYSSLNNNGNYTIGYGNNENYVVTITNPTNQKIRVRTQYIQLADANDVLRFYDGKDTLQPLLASYNKSLLTNELIISSFNAITISFKSGFQNVSKGFRLRLDEANLKGYALSSASCLNSTPASDACINAPVICNLNGYCGNTSGQYTPDNTNITGFCGSIENNSWLSFIASSTTAQFEFLSAGCQSSSSGIQAIMYASTNCSNFSQISNCVSQGSSSGSFTITTNTPLVPGTKYYIMVDGYGGNVCNYSVTAQSGVATTAQINASQDQICPGNSTQLSSAVPSTSYTWTASDGTILPNTATITVSPTITTTYTLSMGASDCFPTGTSGVKTITVTTNLPAPNISSPGNVCDNSNVNLTSLTNGGTYNWSGPNGFTSNVQNPTIYNFTSANVGTYSLTIDYGSGCSTQQATVSVGLLPSPTVGLVASPSATLCAGSQLTLTASGAGGFQLNPYSWSWNSNEATVELESCVNVPLFGIVCSSSFSIFPGTGSGPNAIVTPSVSTQICVNVTGSNGCIGTKCQNITVLSNSALNVSPSVTTCPTQPVILSVDGASTYTWDPSISLSSANDATVSANPLVTTVYTVTGIGCNSVVLTNTVEVTVGVNPPTLTSIQSPSVVCPYQTDVTFSVNNISNTTYNWTLPAGAIITSTNSTANEVIANMGGSTGIYTVVVTATNNCGATTQTTTIEISQIPVLVSASTPSICSPGSSTLSVSGAYWYNWQPTVGLSASSGTMSTYVASPSTTTNYTVTGTDGACIGTATVNIQVINNTVTITATPSSICAGQTSQLQASSSTATSYTWSTGVTPQSTINVSPTSTTTYSIIGNSTCPEKGFVTVVVNPNPVITINNPVICANQSATLTANGAATFTWNNTSTSNPLIVTPTNSTNYFVTGTSAFGCVGTGSAVVTVNNPQASFTGITNDVVTTGTILTLQNTSTGASNYLWITCDGTSNSSSTLSLPIQDTGLCCIKLYAYQGQCVDSLGTCIKVILPTHIDVPNVFTPNGDGKNDVFKLDASGIKEITVSIFNRWGSKIIELTGTGNIYWDGKTKGGTIAADGTYFYVLSAIGLDETKYDLKGTINLFR